MKEIEVNNKILIIDDITETNALAVGKTGIVKAIKDDVYIIHMDKYIEGWGNLALNIPSGYGVCCLKTEIALVE